MKRFYTLMLLVFVLLLMLPVHVQAADTGATPTHVNITVVMQDSATTPMQEDSEPPTLSYIPETASNVPTLYPIDVYDAVENGIRWVVKTYELSPLENHADIPRENFERDGWLYSVTDITKKDAAVTDIRDHTEVVTLNTGSSEVEDILRQLDKTMEFTSEDGYVGILELDISSIKVETAGTKSSGYTVSAKREYPHLSSNDTALIPKTITDGGKTLTLSDVDWQAQSVETIDYEQVPTSYTAYATYTGSASKTVVAGYITTAEYHGTLSKLNQDKTIYKVYFIGTEIVPEKTVLEITKPKPTPEGVQDAESETEIETVTDIEDETEATEEQTPETDASLCAMIALSGLLVLLIGMGVGYFIPKRKNKSSNKGESDV